MKIRTYSELIRFKTFEERFDYLSLSGQVGRSTFGFDRHLNQILYKSRIWREVRDLVIIRDSALDLGIGYEIITDLTVHHMNPITIEELETRDPRIYDPEFLITTCPNTHRAIHYGDQSLLPKPLVVRQPGDTKLW